MLNKKSLFGLALLIPLLGAAIPAEAAKDTTAARAACFEQANAAVAALRADATPAEKNARGVSAYRACAAKAGIKP
jgi:hypothetical protein